MCRVVDALITFAEVRADRIRNPQVAGDGTALELLIAPRFQTLLEAVLPEVTVDPRGVSRSIARLVLDDRTSRCSTRDACPGIHRAQGARKSDQPDTWRGHDSDQFKRFTSLHDWALTNFVVIEERAVKCCRRGARGAIHGFGPRTTDAAAEQLIRGTVHEALSESSAPWPSPVRNRRATLKASLNSLAMRPGSSAT